MFVSGNQVQDQVIQGLSTGAATAKQLSVIANVSVQSVHKVLKKLLKNKVILKNKTLYSLNQEWVVSIYNKLSNNPLLDLSPGESIKYNFNSFEHSERFWKHAVLPHIKQNSQIFIYNPHWIWWYLPENTGSEHDFVKTFNKQNRGYFLIGSEDTVDKKVRREFQTDYLRINSFKANQMPRHQFFTVIGSVVITTQISKNTAVSIDNLYAKIESEHELRYSLKPILQKINNKLLIKIENNQIKADKIRKTISKDFVL